MQHSEYVDIVKTAEEPLGLLAKRSFEPFSPTFLDGADYYQHYADQWADIDHRSRIANRTPLQIERDRVLYSGGMRKLTEKYHVLYSGERRITRNFTTHTMRMAQVARAISHGLKLNADFAEAIALGVKVGAPPFVHASKSTVAKWIKEKLKDLDHEESSALARETGTPHQKGLFKSIAKDSTLPSWLSAIESQKIADSIRRFIPWAAGKDVDEPYSSGSQSYWTLATDPFLVQSKPKRFSPETMFGIWRHSLGLSHGPQTFLHQFQFDKDPRGQHEIRWDHITYEGIVVQYADDITWVIENLDDAHRGSVLAGGADIYMATLEDLREHGKVPSALNDAMLERDSGSLYNYFITEFIGTSQDIIDRLKEGAEYRQALRTGSSEARIALSATTEDQLQRMKSFLNDRVFSEPRVHNRFQILQTISHACLDLLYSGRQDALENYVNTQSIILKLRDHSEKFDRVKALLREPVHRVQLAVDVFSQMSDQEIYDFVGIQGL
jgi:dGTP triphosphohydrolase